MNQQSPSKITTRPIARFVTACQQHPEQAGQTYIEHFFYATPIAIKMIAGGLGLIIHAIAPGCFQTTASRTIKKLNKQICARHKIIE